MAAAAILDFENVEILGTGRLKTAKMHHHAKMIGCLPYFHTWCGLSANLECRSEMCCTRLAENTGCKKSPSWHHRTILSGYIFATKARIDNRKKLLSSNISSKCPPQYGELPPTSGWDCVVSLGHSSKFQRVSRLGSVTERHSSIGRQPNVAALNRGRHLYSAERPSRWTLTDILVTIISTFYVYDISVKLLFLIKK